MFTDDNVLFELRGPFGIPVQFGSSLLFLGFIFLSFGDAEELMYSTIFLGLILISIFLHELGHAWGCLIQGVPVRRIMIYGGGGFCEHARSTSAHQDELIVAMGPIVNITLWALASLSLHFIQYGPTFWLVSSFASINLFLAIMNMIPVLPLDGGKLFHLFLMRLMPVMTATRIAGAVGLILSVIWIPAMLASWFYLGFVLLFLPNIILHWQMLRVSR